MRYVVRNIDINVETLSGMGMFHATHFAVLCRTNEEEPKGNLKITPNSGRKLNLEIPSESHELQPVDMGNKKPEPVMEGKVVDEWYEHDRKFTDNMFKKELVSISSRLVQQQPTFNEFLGGLVLTIDVKQ